MKYICSKCKVLKAKSDFFFRDKSKDKLHSQCKECYSAQRQKNYYEHYQKYKNFYRERAKLRREALKQEFRDNMRNYLSDKRCLDCSEDDIRVLEFDHTDPQKKEFTVSQAVKLGKSWKHVLEEIEKCDIVCANCHKKRTSKMFKRYKA